MQAFQLQVRDYLIDEEDVVIQQPFTFLCANIGVRGWPVSRDQMHAASHLIQEVLPDKRDRASASVLAVDGYIPLQTKHSVRASIHKPFQESLKIPSLWVGLSRLDTFKGHR